MKRVYLAAGWFNEKQMKQMNEIYNVLSMFDKDGEIELFAPFYLIRSLGMDE